MYEMCDMGYWVVSQKDTGKVIGRAGMEPKFWNHKKTVVEMGYIIDEKYREEASKRGAVYIHCRIKKSNVPSKNLAQKLGFEPIEYRLEGDDKDMEVWRYTC